MNIKGFLCKRPFSSFVQKNGPNFTAKLVEKGQIKTITLPDLLRNPTNPTKPGYALLLFYPLNFTFVCPTELTGYADRLNEFHEEGCRVVGLSVDSEYSHLNWMKQLRCEGGLFHETKGFDLPLISDLSKEISRSYGVLNTTGTVALRGLVLLDPTGIIRHHSVNDLGIGRSVDESLRLVQACKWVDEVGEVCPVNWKKGEDGINPSKSSEYFKKIK